MKNTSKIISATTILTVILAGVFSIWSCNESPTAPSGSNWTTVTLDTNYMLTGVVWADGQYVAVGGIDTGYGSSGVILTSPNGLNWTKRYLGGGYINYIALINNILFIDGGSTGLMSIAGIGLKIIGGVGFPVTWNGSEYISYGDGSFMTSTNGLNWNLGELETEAELYSMASNGSITVGVGGNFINDTAYMGSIATSTDGTDWTYKMVDSVKSINSAVWTGKEFLAISGNPVLSPVGFPTIFTSPDGITWASKKLSTSGNPYGLIYDGTKFSALEFTDTLPTSFGILSSSDGSSWTSNSLKIGGFIRSISSSGTELVGVGNNGTVLISQ